MEKIILTGASSGLGHDILNTLINNDYQVICINRKNNHNIQSLADASNGLVDLYEYDLTNTKDIPNLVSSITKKHGAIFGLINNAGVGLDGLLATQHNSEISKILKVNLQAPILLSKYVCRSMLTNKKGRIIHISSITATTGFNGLAVYGATKAGLIGFTKSLSRELGRAHITVNCISPGFMKTKMTESLEGKKLKSIERRSPLGIPTTLDVSEAVLFLLSNGAARITGTTLTIDGGSTA